MTFDSTEWQDQWIAENYPNSLFLVDRKSGEVWVGLGFDEDGNDCT
jgi:hypothetical protein